MMSLFKTCKFLITLFVFFFLLSQNSKWSNSLIVFDSECFPLHGEFFFVEVFSPPVCGRNCPDWFFCICFCKVTQRFYSI